MKDIEAYPLYWPPGRPRTKNPQFASQFIKRSLNDARNEMREELRRLGATRVIVSTNRKLRQDGEFYASSREPEDSGVAVYFRLRGQDMCFACDAWNLNVDNIWAIRKTIEALRGIERWGVGEAMERAFRGFAALPEPLTTPAPWWEVLGVPSTASAETIRARRRALAQRYHPDTGGPEASHERMADINRAVDEGLKQRKGAA